MPSKGICVYSYISVPDVEIEFTVPKVSIVNTTANNFSCTDLEVESKNIPGTENFTGQFQWRVIRDGLELASAYNNINSLSGRLEGGTMTKTEGALSILIDDLIISYGFYDAGVGYAGLPDKEQCWITVSPNHEGWMGIVAPVGSVEATKPFSRFVLAAPHDCGMCSMQSADTVLQGANSDVVNCLTPHIKEIQWFADMVYTIPTMLSLGARYFEFRPADLMAVFQDVSPIPNKPHFQHACIPGLAFDTFLTQLVEFLSTHATEIVTIHIRWDNIISECRKPTVPEINAILDAACSQASTPLTWGGSDCFAQPIETLRSTGKRLIVLIEASKYDSWTAAAYATLRADSILAQFESMNTAGQQSSDLTVLQCQATSQSIKEVLVHSVVASNASSSSLTSTKGALDRVTLPWIRENLLERLQAERLVVVMNDFIDGATTDTSVELSKRRLAL